MAYIPCFLCGTDLAIRTDNHQKPYFICDPCGLQAFVRKQTGIVQLEKFLRNLRAQDFQFAKHRESFLQVCAVLREIDDLQREIRKLESKIGFFSDDPATERAILQWRLSNRLKRGTASGRRSKPRPTILAHGLRMPRNTSRT